MDAWPSCRGCWAQSRPALAHLPSLPPVLACVADPFYKIAAEALLVLQELVALYLGRASEAGPEPYVGEMSAATLARQTTDLDQEVKERGHLLHGPSVAGPPIWATGSGTTWSRRSCSSPGHACGTRSPALAVKALTLVAVSPLKISLQPILAERCPSWPPSCAEPAQALRLATRGPGCAGPEPGPWSRRPPCGPCWRAARPGQRAACTWPS